MALGLSVRPEGGEMGGMSWYVLSFVRGLGLRGLVLKRGV